MARGIPQPVVLAGIPTPFAMGDEHEGDDRGGLDAAMNPLVWTTTRPTVLGWYWLMEQYEETPVIVRIDEEPPEMVWFVGASDAEALDTFTDSRWAGPLVPPEGP